MMNGDGNARPGFGEAVEAARRAASEWETFVAGDGERSIRMKDPRTPEEIAADVVAAAYPIIERALRKPSGG